MKLTQNAILLLKDLIQIESFSKNEALTAQRIEKWFKNHNIPYNMRDNNIWAVNKNYNKKPTLLLNSHHDTVFQMKLLGIHLRQILLMANYLDSEAMMLEVH